MIEKDLILQFIDSRIVKILDIEKSSIEEMSTFTFPDIISGNGDIDNPKHDVFIQKIHMHEVMSKDLPIDVDHTKMVRYLRSQYDVTNGFVYLSNDTGSFTCIECFGEKKNRFIILTHRHHIMKSLYTTQMQLTKAIKKREVLIHG